MSENQFRLRHLPDPVYQLLLQSEYAPKVGSKSPRQEWGRAAFCLIALSFVDYNICVYAVALWLYALQIAKNFRKEEDLQATDVIKGKSVLQYAALTEIYEKYKKGQTSFLEVVNKLCNVLYYSVQDYARNNDLEDFLASIKYVCALVGMPVVIAMECAAAKYKERSAQAEKNSPNEYKAMKRVLDAHAHLVPQLYVSGQRE